MPPFDFSSEKENKKGRKEEYGLKLKCKAQAGENARGNTLFSESKINAPYCKSGINAVSLSPVCAV